MPINWFPGHMNKARRQLRQRAAKSDMFVEVLDARLPRSSQNPLLSKWCGDLPCLRILTKADLADPAVTKRWLAELSGDRTRTLAIITSEHKQARRVVQACRALVPSRGQPGFPVRVMIAGIPNVGKSSLFNLLVGKKKAAVRDQPAVTRMEQRIEVPGGLSLVDTPGVLWPKLSNQEGAYRLAASGAIRDSVLDPLEVARFVVEWLQRSSPSALLERFKLPSLAADPDEVLRAIAQKRGCLTRGVGPDMAKVSELLLVELRAGKLGRLTYETPEEFARPENAEDEDTELAEEPTQDPPAAEGDG